MAFYYTLCIECYHEQDAVRIHERLQQWMAVILGREVSMARVSVEPEAGLWYVYASPAGPGYSAFGYGEGWNEPETVALLEDGLYDFLASEAGIRRALCGYEAQDVFRGAENELELEDLDVPNLVFDRKLRSDSEGRREDDVELGPLYYRKGR